MLSSQSYATIMIYYMESCAYRPDSTSGKTFASGTGGMRFKSRADQIYHTLPTTRHRCNLDCVGLVSEYNEDLI